MQAAAVVLGAITLALVIVAVRLVVATRVQLELLRQRVEAGGRPVLADVLLTAPVPADMGAEEGTAGPTIETSLPGIQPRRIDPRRPFVAFEGDKVYLSVPLRNVGGGLAVIDAGAVALTGSLVGELEYRAVQREHVPVGETTRIDLIAGRLPGEPTDPSDTTWELTVPYSDPGQGQRTVARLQITGRGEDWFIEHVEQEPVRDHSEERPEPARPGRAPRRAGVRAEPVVDVWGNPVQPRRRRR
jgi:hypothetical protein